MASKLNSEFNYRHQVMGETIWEKIKILNGFLEGRVRAAALEEVGLMRSRAKVLELEHMKDSNALPHVIMNLEADLLEAKSHIPASTHAFELNKEEVLMLERLLAEAYVIAEETRIPGYTDEQMFEANAANEFTVMIGKEMHAEIIANGRPSAAKIRNAMSNPHTWNALKQAGLIPENVQVLTANNDPLNIGFKEVLKLNSKT